MSVKTIHTAVKKAVYAGKLKKIGSIKALVRSSGIRGGYAKFWESSGRRMKNANHDSRR